MSPAPGGALGALEASGLGQAMRQWLWLYPTVETVHLVGIGLLFGSIAVFDLRLLGFSRSISVKQLSRHVLPWTAGELRPHHSERPADVHGARERVHRQRGIHPQDAADHGGRA